jgi:hypothetical protein
MGRASLVEGLITVTSGRSELKSGANIAMVSGDLNPGRLRSFNDDNPSLRPHKLNRKQFIGFGVLALCS